MVKDVSWVVRKSDEVEEIIIKLAKQGKSSAEIGTILRDSYGVPLTKVVAKKSISSIMRAKGLFPKYPEPFMNMLRRSVKIRAHLEKNKKDAHSIRSLELTESKIRRLGKYYRKQGDLPADWKYNPEMTKLIVGAK
jgi:small subunit ribosomal protein S15